MSEELVLYSQKNLVNHFRVVAYLASPDRLVKASVSETKYGAVVAKVMPMREWNHLAELREEERNKLLWFHLMDKLVAWMRTIEVTLEVGCQHGETEVVFHGGPLDGVTWIQPTDERGVPAQAMRAPVPPSLEDLIFSMDKPYDTFSEDVRYERERLPREDAMWHYHKR